MITEFLSGNNIWRKAAAELVAATVSAAAFVTLGNGIHHGSAAATAFNIGAVALNAATAMTATVALGFQLLNKCPVEPTPPIETDRVEAFGFRCD